MKYLQIEDHQGLVQCDCGAIFQVDACDEENLLLDGAKNVLVPICPTC